MSTTSNLRAFGVVVERPHDGLHLDEVDDAAEIALRADGQLEDGGDRVEAVAHHLDATLEVGADAVHLVDEAETRHVVLVGLAPHRLGLRLDAGDRVEHRDRAVEDAQDSLDLDGEVDVAGRVDDVDLAVVPLRGGGGRGDRDATLLLLDHVVHHRGAFVHLADLVGATGVVEDPLGRRGLTRVDVSHDPDVAGLFEGKFACHLRVLFGRVVRAGVEGVVSGATVSGADSCRPGDPIARGPVGKRGPRRSGARSASRRGQRRSANSPVTARIIMDLIVPFGRSTSGSARKLCSTPPFSGDLPGA